MVLPGIIVLIVIVVLLVIGGAIWGILTLVKRKKEKKKKEEEGKVAHGLYVGPLQNRISQKTDIRIPLIYSSNIGEPTIQFHALDGTNIIGSIMAVFDTGSGQVWVAEDCPLTCKEKVSQECPSCQGLGSAHTKSLSGWNPPVRTSKCAVLSGQQFQNFCQPCMTSNSKLGSCVCKYKGCGPGLCSGGGECNIYYTPRAGKLTIVDSLGNYLTVCGYVGIGNGESYGIKCGGISGILGMWNFTQPIISPTSFLYNFYNNLGKGNNCFPQDRLNFSFNSWTDNQTNINMEVVFQDTTVDKTPINYTPILPPVSSNHAPFYLIRIKAIKIGGHHYLLDDQHIILDTGTGQGGQFSQKIFCLINQHLPGQMRQDNGCSETLPSFKLAAIPPDAPTIAFKLQGTGKDFWITYQPKDYIYTNEALNQSKFNADADDIVHLFQNPGSDPNQSLMGNSCFLNRSLTFDLMNSQVGFRNLDSTGQVAKPIMSERAVLETNMPTMDVTKKKLVPLVIKGPIKKIPRITIAPIPISHLIHSHKLKAVALQSGEKRCCRDQEASGWPGCE